MKQKLIPNKTIYCIKRLKHFSRDKKEYYIPQNNYILFIWITNMK